MNTEPILIHDLPCRSLHSKKLCDVSNIQTPKFSCATSVRCGPQTATSCVTHEEGSLFAMKPFQVSWREAAENPIHTEMVPDTDPDALEGASPFLSISHTSPNPPQPHQSGGREHQSHALQAYAMSPCNCEPNCTAEGKCKLAQHRYARSPGMSQQLDPVAGPSSYSLHCCLSETCCSEGCIQAGTAGRSARLGKIFYVLFECPRVVMSRW